MSSPEETFLLECDELLTAMEEALLQMEISQSDPDAINSVFRAAHTIKGTGGVFGFDSVVSFTHVVENVLDKVRKNELKIDSDLIAVLLTCRDHIQLLVTSAVAGEEISDEEKGTGNNLINSLNNYLDNKESSSDIKDLQGTGTNVEVENEGQVVDSDNWHISLRFDKEVLKFGMDPISFIRYLQNIGHIIHVTTLYDDMPDNDDFDPELCYLGFEIDFSSSVDKEKIENVFDFVREMCDLYILPPRARISDYSDVIESLPEDEMRIGEILVASGALTENELKDALSYQENIMSKDDQSPTQPIGEVLIDKNAVHKEVVEVALEKQSKNNAAIAGQHVIRVDAVKLDSLINLVGELVISGATTNMLAHKNGNEKLVESMSGMSRLVEEIRDNALNLRMVPIGETFNRFKRVVRDVSKDMNKDIKLIIEGADTELDKTVVEKIGDPLMHLIRNAIDHGIETAEERQAAGKSPQGNLRLNAYHDSGSIVIEVTDDGKGLSRDKILEKAHENGLIADGQVLTDNEVFRLIFEAGLTTAETVTNLSGRGVGMDVVRRNIEALRGTVDVRSNENEGTTVSIRLPLTLAIIDGFLVRVGDSSYVIPLDMVNECIELNKNEHHDTGMHGYINLRDEVLPYLRLRDYFEEPDGKQGLESIVVVKYGTHTAGFVVDELLGELQTVIKPMGKILQNLKGVSGATILGSGDVAIILDVPNLVLRAMHAATLSGVGEGAISSQENAVLH